MLYSACHETYLNQDDPLCFTGPQTMVICCSVLALPKWALWIVMQYVHGENAEGPQFLQKRDYCTMPLIYQTYIKYISNCRVQAVTVESTKGRQVWMGSNGRGTGESKKMWRKHRTRVDSRTEGPNKEPGEDRKQLRKLIFLSRITGWSNTINGEGIKILTQIPDK